MSRKLPANRRPRFAMAKLPFVLALAALLMPDAPARNLLQQSVSPLPVYDAVTIKPSNSPEQGVSINVDNDTFAARNVTVKILIVNAFDVRPELILGLPGWASSQRFDLNAKITDPDLKRMKSLPRDQRAAMVAAVLADRFHLSTRFETRTLPIYELVVASTGSKLAPAMPGSPTDNGRFSIHSSEMIATGVAIANFAANLSYQVDRTVIDKTGLTGRYDFQLRWTPDNVADGAPPDAPPTLFTALEEQLGLKLKPARGPVPALVIDHIEQPTQN